MAFPTGWGRRVDLAIQASQVNANQVDYPLLLTETSLPLLMFDADGSAPALNGGGDIRFSLDEDGSTQLACEIVSFSIDNDPHNGKAEIWVKVPSLSSSTDTIIYIWYNKADVTQPIPSDTYGSENVWDNNFKMVQHMEDDTSSTVTDSTSNANDGTKKDADEPIEIAGIVGKAQDFDGVDDYIESSYSPGSSGSIEFLFMPKTTWDSSTGDKDLFDSPSGRNSIRQNWAHPNPPAGTNNGSIDFVITPSYDNYSDLETNQVVWNANTWFYILFSWDGSYQKVYVNGSLDASISQTQNGGWGGVEVGGSSAHGSYADVVIDESRFSDVARSADWSQIVSNNLNDPSSFVTVVGSPEIVSASIAPNNIYVDLTFSRGVWGDASRSITISKDDFEVIFSQNSNAGGLTTGAQIEDLYTSASLDTTLAAGTGYSEVYAKLTLFGDSPAGVETIELKPASASSIYGAYGNAIPITETSGVLTLNAAVSVTLDWSAFDTAMSEVNSIFSILLPSLFGHGLHVFFTDKSLFQEVENDLHTRISDLPAGDQALGIELLNFFQRFYGR